MATDVRERGLRPPSDAGTAGEFLARATIIVPDFIPVAGQLDDAIVVALALRWLLRGVDPAVLDELWPGPPAGLNLLKRAAGLGRRSTESPTD